MTIRTSSATVCSLFVLTLALAAPTARAESAAQVAAAAQAAVDAGKTPEWCPRLAEQLKLDDEAKTKAVGELVTEHFARVWAWDQHVKDKLNAAWSAWDAARDNSNGKEKNEMKALTVATEQLDPIYAEFAPQIHHFLTAMRAAVGEEKAIEMVDIITHSPGAKRTYDAYLGMVPEMKDDEKALLWSRMESARIEALSAWSDGQVVKIFKKYKVRNEASIDDFGYDYRKRYEAWAKAQQ
jgi:hypothetical protein